MDQLLLDIAVVVHALARAGAIDDARRTVDRVKSSSRRGPLRAMAVALAELGRADDARRTALELPSGGAPYSARSTLVEVADVLARRGDFAEAIKTAEELEDVEQSVRTLADLAQLQAEVEVGNFAAVRTIPARDSDHSWVYMQKLFLHAGRLGRTAMSPWGQTLRKAIQRAQAIKKGSGKPVVLEILAHHLAWGGDAEGALLAVQGIDGAARQEKALVKVVEGLSGAGDFTTAEQVTAGIKSKAVRAEAQHKLDEAKTRGGGVAGEAWPVEPWADVLKGAARFDHPDERITAIVSHVAFHHLPEDGRKANIAALLSVRAALLDGDKAIKAAGLSRDRVMAGADASVVKWRYKGPEKDVEAARAARLCRIAGSLGILGDAAAGTETVNRIQDGDFRACALALLVSGELEFHERLRHGEPSRRG